MENAERTMKMVVYIARTKWSWDTKYTYVVSQSKLDGDSFVPVGKVVINFPLPSEEALILTEIADLDKQIQKAKATSYQMIATLEEAKQKLLALPPVTEATPQFTIQELSDDFPF